MICLIPPADLDVVGVGRVRAGQPVDVPDDIAGRPPDPRLEVAMRELVEAHAAVDHHRAAALRAEIATLDYGTGLLAQGWQRVENKSKKKEEAES